MLVETGWSRHWNTPQYFEGHPFLTEDAARFLADCGAALVGIDSHNIDDVQDLRRPVHSLLLKREIPIVEHMTNLAAVPQVDFRFFAVPVKVKGFGRFRCGLSRLSSGSLSCLALPSVFPRLVAKKTGLIQKVRLTPGQSCD